MKNINNFSRGNYFLFIIILSFLFLLKSFSANAQKKITEDVIYLKNGSIIRGKIIENKPNETIKIKTTDRNEWVFRQEEIEKIQTEEYKPEREFFSKNKGIYYVISTGLIIGNRNNWNTNLNFTNYFAAGYKFHRLLGVGGAAGLDVTDDILFFPLMLETRGNLLDKAVTPYYFVQAGYSLPVNSSNSGDKELKGGVIFNPSLGLQFSLSKDVAMLLDAGIKIQKYHTYMQTRGGDIKRDITLRRLTMRLGFIF
jgi:hypothetical protein